MQLANGLTPYLEHAEASSSNAGLIKKEKKEKRERKRKTQRYRAVPARRRDMQPTPRESTCAEDDDEEEQRACHRVTNIGCTRGGPDSTVSRWRWSLGGSGGLGQGQQGVRKRGMDGWASCELSGAGRLVRLYYPRE